MLVVEWVWKQKSVGGTSVTRSRETARERPSSREAARALTRRVAPSRRNGVRATCKEVDSRHVVRLRGNPRIADTTEGVLGLISNEP